MTVGIRKFLLIGVISVMTIASPHAGHAYGGKTDPFFDGVDCTAVLFSFDPENTDIAREEMPGFSVKPIANAIQSLVEQRKKDGLNIYFVNSGHTEDVCPNKEKTLLYDIKVSSRWGRFLNPPLKENFVILSSSYQRLDPNRRYPARGFYTPKLMRLAKDQSVFLKELSDAADEELKQFIDKPLLKKEYKPKDVSRNPGNMWLMGY